MVVNLIEWSTKFIEAEKTGKRIDPPSKVLPGINEREAYQIQLETINRKQELGQKITGKKIGLTSTAMQRLLGIDEPDYGHLLNGMELGKNAVVSKKSVIQPKVEAEIAFVLKEDLKGPNVTAEDVLEATDYLVASIEVVDSRVLDWKITLPDTIADNASSGLYILSDRHVSPSDINLSSIKMKLFQNGEFINEGKGEDVLGNPANSVAWLVNKLHEFKITLNKGEIILSGALSAAIDAKSGDTFYADFGEILGGVSIHFE
ncbi:2-keto-4-pentenoate hydratase [Cytobacillus praedii]|uniref:2-keto-4-pentenoate hydratase n=1 Tax=Cytobacillus praedii TaxID=1742358 RepID=A0A4R1B329_9BACI|nr:fumarylacetoacetate hydrolase family protein [Cytobacillus praedii]TCJ04332.1 2-keto-4-pentenoate hydratase [Cytobacillus praedii]